MSIPCEENAPLKEISITTLVEVYNNNINLVVIITLRNTSIELHSDLFIDTQRQRLLFMRVRFVSYSNSNIANVFEVIIEIKTPIF